MKHRAVSALLAAVWGGLILGVSFLATIAKFGAPSLSLPVALDVGRHTFQQLVRIEWLLTVAAVALLILVRPSTRLLALWATSTGLLLLEAFWLLPVLDRRVQVILDGGSPPPSNDHVWFIAAEAARAGLLLLIAWWSVSDLDRKQIGSQPLAHPRA